MLYINKNYFIVWIWLLTDPWSFCKKKKKKHSASYTRKNPHPCVYCVCRRENVVSTFFIIIIILDIKTMNEKKKQEYKIVIDLCKIIWKILTPILIDHGLTIKYLRVMTETSFSSFGIFYYYFFHSFILIDIIVYLHTYCMVSSLKKEKLS